MTTSRRERQRPEGSEASLFAAANIVLGPQRRESLSLACGSLRQRSDMTIIRLGRIHHVSTLPRSND
ncbi:MAG: hypothetical protein WKF63_05780 [Thermomicrobiales bacterium]